MLQLLKWQDATTLPAHAQQTLIQTPAGLALATFVLTPDAPNPVDARPHWTLPDGQNVSAPLRWCPLEAPQDTALFEVSMTWAGKTQRLGICTDFGGAVHCASRHAERVAQTIDERPGLLDFMRSGPEAWQASWLDMDFEIVPLGLWSEDGQD